MTDNELIQRCKSGQTELMDILIERYKTALYTMCRKLTMNAVDADDLFQDTWIKAVRNIERFEPGKNFATWLFTICVNLYRDKYRRKKRWMKRVKSYFSSAELERETAEIKSDLPDTDEEVIENEMKTMLQNSIDRLDDIYRIPLLLYYYRELSVAEVSGILEIPEGTVKSRLAAARQKLKDMIKE
jgi:RNA polymerase sigma-70 factor (ECF subfamily)